MSRRFKYSEDATHAIVSILKGHRRYLRKGIFQRMAIAATYWSRVGRYGSKDESSDIRVAREGREGQKSVEVSAELPSRPSDDRLTAPMTCCEFERQLELDASDSIPLTPSVTFCESLGAKLLLPK